MLLAVRWPLFPDLPDSQHSPDSPDPLNPPDSPDEPDSPYSPESLNPPNSPESSDSPDQSKCRIRAVFYVLFLLVSLRKLIKINLLFCKGWRKRCSKCSKVWKSFFQWEFVCISYFEFIVGTNFTKYGHHSNVAEVEFQIKLTYE